MSVVHNQNNGIGYDTDLVELCIKKIFTDHNRILESLVITQLSDEELKEINVNFLNHNYFTDIITFDNGFDRAIEGELFLSYDRVKENEIVLNSSKEIYRVIIHGCLHLCGFNDHSDIEKSQMRDLEDKYLKVIVPRGTKT